MIIRKEDHLVEGNETNVEIKAVLFDMDGLVFDTEQLAEKGWLQAGEMFGFPVTVKETALIRGRNALASRRLFQEWYGENDFYDQGKEIRNSYILDYIKVNGMPVKEGMHELFSYLRENGIKTALATSTQRECVEEYFKYTDLPYAFDITVCGTEVKNGKPAPDIFLTAAKKLGVNPEQCLVLEDSPNGIMAGHAAGCKVIMIPDMDRPEETITKLCTKVCQNLREIITYLQQKN